MTSAAPAGDKQAGQLLLGLAPATANTAALLPPAFLRRLGLGHGVIPPHAVIRNLPDGLQAFRYDDLHPKGLSQSVTVLASPTTAGVAIAACLTPTAGTPPDKACRAAAPRLTIAGASGYPVGPGPGICRRGQSHLHPPGRATERTPGRPRCGDHPERPGVHRRCDRACLSIRPQSIGRAASEPGRSCRQHAAGASARVDTSCVPRRLGRGAQQFQQRLPTRGTPRCWSAGGRRGRPFATQARRLCQPDHQPLPAAFDPAIDKGHCDVSCASAPPQTQSSPQPQAPASQQSSPRPTHRPKPSPRADPIAAGRSAAAKEWPTDSGRPVRAGRRRWLLRLNHGVTYGPGAQALPTKSPGATSDSSDIANGPVITRP